MAELNSSTMVPNGQAAGEKPGTLDLVFSVWPKGEPARIVTRKSEETGKDIQVKIARIPLFRCRGNKADFGGWKLSGFWEDVRFAMWPLWAPVIEANDLRETDSPEATVMPMMSVTGMVNEKPGFTAMGTSQQSVTAHDLPYRWDDYQGAFCYDKAKGKTLPLNLGAVQALRRAFRNQLDNVDTVGSRDNVTDKPRILWLPESRYGTKAELAESAVLEENFRIFESWSEKHDETGKIERPGKIVYWELERADVTQARR